MLLRSRVPALVFLGAAAVNASLVAPFVLGSGPPAGDGPRLSVLSFNVGVSNPMRAEIAAYTAAERPDLLVVIESSFEWEDALAADGPAMSLVAIVPPGRVSGITLMADPGLLAKPLPVPFADPEEAVAAEVTLDGQRMIVLALHPPSPTSGARAARRNAVLAEAAGWVRDAGRPVLVVGDLNSTPWSPAYQDLWLVGGLVDSARGAGLQPTWPEGWGPAMIPIDHALHTPDLGTVDRETGPSFGSAHRPLLVTVSFAG
jgi:endonuclease/exonuclease/phosphatase (EEP) superfamily protein YafD